MGSKPVAGGERSDTSGFPASHLTRPRRVSKQIAFEPSDPTCPIDWTRLSINSFGNPSCAASGGLIRCDPVGVDVIRGGLSGGGAALTSGYSLSSLRDTRFAVANRSISLAPSAVWREPTGPPSASLGDGWTTPERWRESAGIARNISRLARAYGPSECETGRCPNAGANRLVSRGPSDVWRGAYGPSLLSDMTPDGVKASRRR